MSDVAGIATPVETEVRTLAETLDGDLSTSSSVGTRLDVVRAAEAIRELAADAPASVRAVAPTLKRALVASDSEGGAATATDLYAAGLRERCRALVTGTLASVATPSLIRAYEASSYSLRELVDALGRTLTATSADVVRENCLRTLAAIGRTQPDALQEGLDADAMAVGIDWFQRREMPEEWQEAVIAELLAVTGSTLPSLWVDAPVAAMTERLLASESATTRALGRTVRQRAPAGIEGATADVPGKDPFEPLRRLREDTALGDQERRRLARAVGRCVALAPELVADAPAALVARVRLAPRADRALAATALGVVVAATEASDGRAALSKRVNDVAGESRRRRVRLLGEVAVACPDRVTGVPERFRERVAAASQPAAGVVHAVGECVVAAAEGDDSLVVLRRNVRADSNRERAAVALGEWVAHVPDVVDADVDSLSAAVREASDGDREVAAAVLGTYVVVASSEGVESATSVVGPDASPRAARVRGERVLAGDLDGFDLSPETRAGLHESRGATRRFVTQALGVALQYRESTEGGPLGALRLAVASSAFDERPDRLRLLGEWVAATGTSDDWVAALAGRVRETTGRDRERAARALGVAMTGRDAGPRDAAATGAVVARLAVHDEVAGATGRAVQRATSAAGVASVTGTVSTTRLPPGVLAVDRDWPLRVLGETAAVASDRVPAGCGSLATMVAEADGWDRESAARALGAALVVETHPAPGILGWATSGLGGTPESRGAMTYTLGEVAAAQRPSFPGVPDTLAASVRETSGSVRTTTARALGEYVRLPALPEPSSMTALRNAARDAEGDARADLTRALGEFIVAVPDPGVDVSSLLVAAVADATGQDRRALARLLGELAVTDDPGDVLDRVAPTEADASVFERARRSRMTRGLAAAESVSASDLIAAISVDVTDDHAPKSPEFVDATPVEALLESPPPIRDPLLDALATALRAHATTTHDRYPQTTSDLGTQLDAWMRESTDADPAGRLHAMAARSAIDTTAATRKH